MKLRPILANKVYVPVTMVDEETLKEHYERDIYIEKTCAKCPIMKQGMQRPAILKLKWGNSENVMNCLDCKWGAYTGHFISYSKVNIKGNAYWAVPAGDLSKVEENLDIDLTKAIDLRCDLKSKHKITFTKKLYTGKELRNGEPAPNQAKIIRQFFKSRGQTGVIKALPRSGKTVLAVYLICKFQRTALVLAHEKLLLDQFYKAFTDFTDIKEMEERLGKKLIVIAKTEKDLELDVPVLLVNYQKFITELGLKRVAKHLSKKRGVAIVDEIHRSASDRYNDLLNRLDAKRKIGLTATDNRKDGKYVLTLETLGRVVAESTVKAMTPTVYLKETEFKPKTQWRGRRAYGNATSWLGENQKRNFDIIKQVFADLRKNPKYSIVIPVVKVNHARLLTRLINKQAAFNNDNKGEKWGKDLAMMLFAGADKENVLKRARLGKARVVVSIVKFVRDGIDVPAWTHMYVGFPGSNTENAFQMTQRVCTPYEGKPQPVIRLWMDPIDIMKNCVKNTYTDYKGLGYKFGKQSEEKLEGLVNSVKLKDGKWAKTKFDVKASWYKKPAATDIKKGWPSKKKPDTTTKAIRTR